MYDSSKEKKAENVFFNSCKSSREENFDHISMNFKNKTLLKECSIILIFLTSDNRCRKKCLKNQTEHLLWLFIPSVFYPSLIALVLLNLNMKATGTYFERFESSSNFHCLFYGTFCSFKKN